jgi:hypothetical protein
MPQGYIKLGTTWTTLTGGFLYKSASSGGTGWTKITSGYINQQAGAYWVKNFGETKTYTYQWNNKIWVGTNGYISFDQGNIADYVENTVGKVLAMFNADYDQDSLQYMTDQYYFYVLWKGHRHSGGTVNEIVCEVWFKPNADYCFIQVTFPSGVTDRRATGFWADGVQISNYSPSRVTGFKARINFNGTTADSNPLWVGGWGTTWAGWITSTSALNGSLDQGYTLIDTYQGGNPNGPNVTLGTSGITTATINWAEPTSNGGSKIIDYQYRYAQGASPTGSWTRTTAKTVNLTGLTSSKDYYIQVRAANWLGSDGTNGSVYGDYTELKFSTLAAPSVSSVEFYEDTAKNEPALDGYFRVVGSSNSTVYVHATIANTTAGMTYSVRHRIYNIDTGTYPVDVTYTSTAGTISNVTFDAATNTTTLYDVYSGGLTGYTAASSLGSAFRKYQYFVTVTATQNSINYTKSVNNTEIAPPPIPYIGPTPTSGQKPLSVDFTSYISEFPTKYNLNYGDSTETGKISPTYNSGTSRYEYSKTHSYTTDNTFTATITAYPGKQTNTAKITVSPKPGDITIYAIKSFLAGQATIFYKTGTDTGSVQNYMYRYYGSAPFGTSQYTPSSTNSKDTSSDTVYIQTFDMSATYSDTTSTTYKWTWYGYPYYSAGATGVQGNAAYTTPSLVANGASYMGITKDTTNSSVTQTGLTFAWTVGTGSAATHYDVTVVKKSDGTTVGTDDSNITTKSISRSGLTAATIYTVKITPKYNYTGSLYYSGTQQTFDVTTDSPSYTITFDKNGGIDGLITSVTQKSPYTITANYPSRSGWHFGSWNTASDGSGTNYTGGDSFSYTSDVTLYAKWAFTAPTPANASGSAAFARTTTTIRWGWNDLSNPSGDYPGNSSISYDWDYRTTRVQQTGSGGINGGTTFTVGASTGIAAGQVIEGTNIPRNPTITVSAINTTNRVVTISGGTLTGTVSGTVNFFSGATTANKAYSNTFDSRTVGGTSYYYVVGQPEAAYNASSRWLRYRQRVVDKDGTAYVGGWSTYA